MKRNLFFGKVLKLNKVKKLTIRRKIICIYELMCNIREEKKSPLNTKHLDFGCKLNLSVAKSSIVLSFQCLEWIGRKIKFTFRNVCALSAYGEKIEIRSR